MLAECGFFPLDVARHLSTRTARRLAGHATHKGMPGVEVPPARSATACRSRAGMALAAQARRRGDRASCVMLSDGECDEGSIWEAALFAPQHRLDNLVAIVDYNKIQSLGRVEDVIDLEPFADKWRAFGWGVREIDGHDLAAIDEALRAVPFDAGRPSCIVAHTVKGKGVHASWRTSCSGTTVAAAGRGRSSGPLRGSARTAS